MFAHGERRWHDECMSHLQGNDVHTCLGAPRGKGIKCRRMRRSGRQSSNVLMPRRQAYRNRIPTRHRRHLSLCNPNQSILLARWPTLDYEVRSERWVFRNSTAQTPAAADPRRIIRAAFGRLVPPDALRPRYCLNGPHFTVGHSLHYAIGCSTLVEIPRNARQ